jgi:hypothetical protein
MANETWDDETSALFVAEINTSVIWKGIAGIVGALGLLLATTFFLGETSFYGITFGLSLIPIYPMIEYAVFLVSVLNKINLDAGRNLFFADRAGYRAKLKANPEVRFYKPTRNLKLIAWAIVAALVIGLAAAMAN